MEEFLELAVGLFGHVLQTPLFWWAFIIISFCLIEILDLGTHSLRWTTRVSRDKAYCNGSVHRYEEETGGPCGELHQTPDPAGRDRMVKKINGHVNQNGVPMVFHNFIQRRLIPTFRSQCQDRDYRFSVLVLSDITSVQDIEKVKFKQITFNGMPLVDPRKIMYPPSYRYENFIVARPSESEHPEAMIMKEIPALVKAYGLNERCHIRSPTPKFVLLYSWTMPCSACSKLIVKSLSRVCIKRVMLAYSQKNEAEKDSVVRESHQILTSAGFVVVKVDPA